ncbi:MAG: FMN-binding glutamate synthase family protein [Planctomycetota bacterium]
MRARIFTTLIVLLLGSVALAVMWPPFWILVGLWAALIAVSIRDVTQRRHAILRNFPVLGHFRYLFEMIRPEIQQYFVEADTDGMPFNRERRSVVYQRAKGALDTLPFGTQWDVYAPGYEWIAHSLLAKAPDHIPPRIWIGRDTCQKPYEASLLNISAMSYGSLSNRAVMALNKGAALGQFAHNTGEGGISRWHLEHGGDLIWQIGTGYFGCRNPEGGFDAERFRANAERPSVKMIEIKLSQGAKPGHGGILPASKVTEEIAEIRHVPLGKDVLSPPAHSAFDSPSGLLQWITELRRLSGGKPVGIKLCVGRPEEFMSLCMAMRATGRHPDFITVDGGEGGTGAAPLEFSNSVGMPLNEGLVFVHNCLVGFGLRERIRLIASGKVLTGFDMVAKFALGCGPLQLRRAMMMAIGCIRPGAAIRTTAQRGGHPGPVAGAGSRRGRQGRAHPAIPRRHRAQPDGAARGRRTGLEPAIDPAPHHAPHCGWPGQNLLPSCTSSSAATIAEPVPEAYEDAWRRASAHLRSSSAPRTGRGPQKRICGLARGRAGPLASPLSVSIRLAGITGSDGRGSLDLLTCFPVVEITGRSFGADDFRQHRWHSFAAAARLGVVAINGGGPAGVWSVPLSLRRGAPCSDWLPRTSPSCPFVLSLQPSCWAAI